MTQVTAVLPGSDPRREARQQWRPALDCLVFLRIGPSGAERPAELFDVSSQGAGLGVDGPIAVGTEVSVVLKATGMSLEFVAVVAWCRELQPAEPSSTAGDMPAPRRFGVGLDIRGSASFLAMLKANPLAHH